DEVDAKFVVVNPGVKFNNRCSVQQFAAVLSRFPKERILFENMPPLRNRTYPHYGRNYDEVQSIIKLTGFGFCLDFCHAAASAYFFEREPVKFCEDLVDLNPTIFHLSNGKKRSFIDQHLHFDEGEFDMVAFRSMLPQDAWVELETPLHEHIQLREIEFLRNGRP
ncbi:MAG: TIM barrel protein, partial [Nanoarchaeota archaeon]